MTIAHDGYEYGDYTVHEDVQWWGNTRAEMGGPRTTKRRCAWCKDMTYGDDRIDSLVFCSTRCREKFEAEYGPMEEREV